MLNPYRLFLENNTTSPSVFPPEVLPGKTMASNILGEQEANDSKIVTALYNEYHNKYENRKQVVDSLIQRAKDLKARHPEIRTNIPTLEN
jgi:hypothetical protein